MPKKENHKTTRAEKKEIKEKARRQKKQKNLIKRLKFGLKTTAQFLVFIFMLVDIFSDEPHIVQRWAFIALGATVVLITLMIINIIESKKKGKKQLKITKSVFDSLIYVFVLLYYFGEYFGGEEIIKYLKYAITILEVLIANYWWVNFIYKRQKKKQAKMIQ